MKYVCVFCGASMGLRPAYREAAEAMGQALVNRGLGLVYGGGRVGLMGTIADTVIAAGGNVIGVIPEFLAAKEIAHAELTELRVVDSMHTRKALMADLADAFIALPGGYGTLEELCEVLTWAQLGLHQKPHALLNVEGYFDPLLRLFDHAVTEQFLTAGLRSLVLQSSDPETLLDLVVNYQPVKIDRWTDQEIRT